MIDVAHSVSLVDFPHDQYFPNNNTPATIATTTPVQASFGFDLTGELIQSTSCVNNFFEIPTLIAAMTFQLSDQDININPSQSNVSPSQQQNSRQYNDMAATAFSNQHQYPHDTSVQQTSILPSPPFVEPSGNYIAISSTTNNTQALPYGYPSSTLPTTNAQSINLETGNHIGNNYSRNTYISNSTQQQQQQQPQPHQQHHHQQHHHQQPQQPQQSHHQSRIELSNQIIPGYFNPNQCLNQYQNSIPSTIGNNSQHHGNHQKPISRSINNFSRQDATTNLPISIAPNLFMQQFNNQSSNGSTMLLPLYDPSTIFTTKPTPTPPVSTTISISQNSTNTTESTSPTKQTYSYSGPPKSYYSRLPLYDRPFKCDQCPQSFNRNHDLKRHKRIHLAVKPYPCQYCEKQFSRKDALKRHVLVKGCNNTSNNNKKSTSNNANNNNNKNVIESTSNTTTTIENYVDNGDQIKTEPTNDSFMSSI